MAAGFPVKENYANGDVLTATNLNDLAGTVNFAVSTTPKTGTQMAGKNAIINGDFGINQRAFTSVTASGTYTFDRWVTRTGGDGTGTFTPQVFTPGTAPVAGYEATNYIRIVTSGSTNSTTLMGLRQNIEDVRTFAGQTVTLSFWAKAGSGTPKIYPELIQSFGSGGSSSVTFAPTAPVTLSTSWARYSLTYNLTGLTGTTIGTNNLLLLNMTLSAGSSFAAPFAAIGIQNATFDIWGVQLESGASATPFQTATGTKQGELAACQRYYQRVTAGSVYGTVTGIGSATSTTAARLFFPILVPLRVAATSIDYANIVLNDGVNTPAAGTITLGLDNPIAQSMNCATTGLTQFRTYILTGNNNAAGYVALNAEI